MPEQPAVAPPSSPERRSLLRRLLALPTPLIFMGAVLLALVLLWQSGSIRDVSETARHSDRWLLVGAMLLYFVSLSLLAARWHLLILMIHRASHAARAAEAFLTSVVINYAAPVGLAVPTRAALTKRALGLSGAETGAVALWEVGADVLVLSLLSLLWILTGGVKALHALDSAISPVLIAGVVAGGIVAMTLALIALRHLKPELWARLHFETVQFFRYPRHYPVDALRAMTVSVLYWVIQIAVLWLLLKAVGVTAGTSLTLGLVSVPILVGMLSPVPGGTGIREALMIAMARVYDADSAAVLLAALVYRVALFAAIPVLYAAVRIWLKMELSASARMPTREPDPVSGADLPAPLEDQR